MAELVTGATVNAELNELILLAKRAYRCHQECRSLVATLMSIEPLLTRISRSSNLGNATFQAWLKELHNLLVQANGIVEDCVVKKSRRSFKYVNRWYLSLRIEDTHRLIKEKLSETSLDIFNIVQEIQCDMYRTSREIDRPLSFEQQVVPSQVVAFDNNPFEKLKESILSMPLDASRIIGIKGRGGAGKTLLAKMVNNDENIKRKYGDHCVWWITIGQDISVPSIYSRVGEFLNDGGVFERDITCRDLESQRTYLMNALEVKKVLVTLDDVWGNTEMDHAMTYWLDIFKGNGSTTLITTRDTEVLNRVRAAKRIEVKSLSEKESWKLFSHHAFHPNMPPSQEVRDIALKICNECKGLPLALEVIGGALWNKNDEGVWKYALSCMKKCESWTNSTTMEDELFHRLKYSYDILDEELKKCFLYFAAFPEDYHIPTKQLYSIWRAEELFGPCNVEDTMMRGRMNLTTLADRSLIDLDDDGSHAKIHDVLRDLAMRIIQDGKPGEWAHECHFEPGKVLKKLPNIKETTKRVSFVGCHIKNSESDVFIEGYDNVQICLLSEMRFDYEREVFNTIPEDFFLGMSHLLYLNLSRCKSLKRLPRSIKALKSIKHLHLEWCESLKVLPESIKELKNLTDLDLWGCKLLKELPKSIKELKSLTHLHLRGCESLEELPESIKELKSLTHLDLCLCESLKELPESIEELQSLMHFNLSYCTSLKELPKSIKGLKSLMHLDLCGCKLLKELPESIKELQSLMHFELSGCESLKKLPQSIKGLKSLTHLDVSYCLSLKELPENIKELKSLTHLDLSYCLSLKELPDNIKELKSLTYLSLSECKSLKELPESIKELKSLTHLDLSYCLSLKELPESIKELKSLMHLYLQGCESLEELRESIKELKSLIELKISGCKSLKKLPKTIKEFKSPTYIDLNKREKGSIIDKYEEYMKLTRICMKEAHEEYLKLSKICMEEPQSITSSVTGFPSLALALNDHQCKYLVDKLKSVVMCADSFRENLIKMKRLRSPSQKERAYYLKIFELLYASAKEVEEFIRSHCVKDAWIRSAMSLTNVSDYVAAIGFDLELWRLLSSHSEILGDRRSKSFTVTDVDNVFNAEVENVNRKASYDRESLLKNMKAVQEKESETSAKAQLAALLLERLEGTKSRTSSDTGHSKMVRLGEGVFPYLSNKIRLVKTGTSVVYKATLLGGAVALKTLMSDNILFNREVSILRGLSHPNIISLLCSGTYPCDGKCTIVEEFMDWDLEGLIETRLEAQCSPEDEKSKSPFDIMEAVDLMLQIGTGMQYLHEKKIVHRDLKSMNILVRRVANKRVVAKVADFGLSKTKENMQTYSSLTPNQGTARWMAPEMMGPYGGESKQNLSLKSTLKSKDKMKYPFKTDIYSFGMVCFEILTGKIPFSSIAVNNHVKSLVLSGERPSLPEDCHPLLESLIKRCWSAEPTERPEFVNICAELRYLKYLLLMQVALGEVEPIASGEVEPVASEEVEPVASEEVEPVASEEVAPVAWGEVEPALSVNKKELVASASNTSTIGLYQNRVINTLIFLPIVTIVCTIVWFRKS